MKKQPAKKGEGLTAMKNTIEEEMAKLQFAVLINALKAHLYETTVDDVQWLALEVAIGKNFGGWPYQFGNN